MKNHNPNKKLKAVLICLFLTFTFTIGCVGGSKYRTVNSASINNKIIFSGMSIDKVTELAGEPDDVRSMSSAMYNGFTGQHVKSYVMLYYGEYRISFKDGIVSEVDKIRPAR